MDAGECDVMAVHSGAGAQGARGRPPGRVLGAGRVVEGATAGAGPRGGGGGRLEGPPANRRAA